MGYAATDIVLYGVKIDEDIAQKIFENELTENYEFIQPEDTLVYRKVAEHCSNRFAQHEPVTTYKAHCEGIGTKVFYLDLVSDGSDSRVHSNKYDVGYEHYLGIHIASKGYAYSDDIKYFIRNPPSEAIEFFNKLAIPVLEKYGFKTVKPAIHIVNQVW